jgi:hypothetical protein
MSFLLLLLLMFQRYAVNIAHGVNLSSGTLFFRSVFFGTDVYSRFVVDVVIGISEGDVRASPLFFGLDQYPHIGAEGANVGEYPTDSVPSATHHSFAGGGDGMGDFDTQLMGHRVLSCRSFLLTVFGISLVLSSQLFDILILVHDASQSDEEFVNVHPWELVGHPFFGQACLEAPEPMVGGI